MAGGLFQHFWLSTRPATTLRSVSVVRTKAASSHKRPKREPVIRLVSPHTHCNSKQDLPQTGFNAFAIEGDSSLLASPFLRPLTASPEQAILTGEHEAAVAEYAYLVASCWERRELFFHSVLDPDFLVPNFIQQVPIAISVANWRRNVRLQKFTLIPVHDPEQ